MKWAMIVSVLMCVGCVTPTVDRWRTVDKVLLGAYAVGAMGDAKTTMDAKRNPRIKEGNPLVDWHGARDSVIVGSQAATVGLVWVVAEKLPEGWQRTTWLGVMAVGKMFVFGNNLWIERKTGGLE